MDLSNALGVLIAFVTIILMLSVMVTAAIQAIQAIFKLRQGNLQWGLRVLMRQKMGMSEGDAQKKLDKLMSTMRGDAKTAREKAVRPSVTWIEPDALLGHMKEAGVITRVDAKAKKFRDEFDEMQGYLKKRFLQHIRVATFITGLVIAFLFQVSTPETLRKLSVDAAYRERVLEQSEPTLKQARETIDRNPHYGQVADKALDELEARHPELKEILEEAAGVGGPREEVVSELQDILALAELKPRQQESLIREYEKLLDERYKKLYRSARKAMSESRDQLAAIDIEIWKDGWAFYNSFDRWIGVLITSILLSFGAPFWYELLSRLLRLRQVLGEKKPEQGASPSP